MNNKNIKKVSLSLAALLAATMALSGCGNSDHRHIFSDFKETKVAAGCLTGGVDIYVCPDDGATYEIETEAVGHEYGDWEITLPTLEAEGKAVKNCVRADDKIEVTLPKLSYDFEGYNRYDAVTPLGPETDGVYKYHVPNKNGEIVFTATLPTRGVVTVGDAVTMGVSHKGDVKSGTGFLDTTTLDTVVIGGEVVSESELDLFRTGYDYDYGPTFLHSRTYGIDVKTGEHGATDTEAYYSMDEDGFIPIGQSGLGSGKIEYLTNANEKMFEGVQLNMTYATTSIYFYGVEPLVSGLYERGNGSLGEKYAESITEKDGEKVYHFQFEAPSFMNQQHWALWKVDFSLDKSGAMKDVTIVATTFLIVDVSDEFGMKKEIDYNGFRYIETMHFEQESGKRDAAVPEAFNKDVILESSVKYTLLDGTVVDKDLTVTAGVVNRIYFNTPDAIQPSTANLDVDPVRVFIRKDGVDKELENGVVDGWINGTVTNLTDPEYGGDAVPQTVTFVSRLYGDTQLVFKTIRTEKVVTLHTEENGPVQLPMTVRTKTSGDKIIWTETNSASVYQSKPLYLDFNKTYSYESKALNFVVKDANGNVVENAVTAVRIDDKDVYALNVAVAGEYTVEITAQKEYIGLEDRYFAKKTMKVTVMPAPDISVLLEGKYIGDGNSNYTVTFAEGVQEVTVAIKNGGSETLTYTYENGELTLAHKSGSSLGYTLSVGDDYKLELSRMAFGEKTTISLLKAEE